jgi:hypothetical protein
MTADERALDRKIDSTAWGVFLLWIGIAVAAHVGWGVGLIGAAAITLGAQALRKRLGVRVERFSLTLGAVFAIIGVWNLFTPRVDLVPLLFILAGIALLASTWRMPRAPGRRTSLGAASHPRA